MSIRWTKAIGVAMVVYAIVYFTAVTPRALVPGVPLGWLMDDTYFVAVDVLVAYFAWALWRLAIGRRGAPWFLAAFSLLTFRAVVQVVTLVWSPSPIPDWFFRYLFPYVSLSALAMLAVGLLLTRLVAAWIPWVGILGLALFEVVRIPFVRDLRVAAFAGPGLARVAGSVSFMLPGALQAVFWAGLGVALYRSSLDAAAWRTSVSSRLPEH